MHNPADTRETLRQRLAALPKAIELLATLFADAPLALQVFTVAGHSLLVNDAFRTLFGTEPPPEYNVLHDELIEASGVREYLVRAFAGERIRAPVIWYDPRQLRQVSVTRGHRVAIEATFVPLRDDARNVTHVAIVFRDVTSERKAREEIESERERLEVILRGVADGITMLDPGGALVYANDAAARLVGLESAEALLRAPPGSLLSQYEYLDERGAPLAPEQLPQRRALAGETIADALVRFRVRGEPQERISVLSSTPIRNGDGTVRFVVNVFRDVTHQQRATDALRESETRFRTMADAAPVLLWVADASKRCVWFNKHWLDFTGRSLDDERGDGWVESVHSDDLLRCLETYNDAFDARQGFRMEFRLRRHDGQYRWVLDTGVPQYGPDGEFEGYIGSCIDIEDRKRAEDVLRFTAQASATLASSLDYHTTLQTVARLVVPRVADWCIIEVLDDAGVLQPIALAHTDPARVALAREYRRRYPVAASDPWGLAAALRSGRSQLTAEVTDDMLERAARDPEQFAMLRALGIRSAMLVPIRVQGSPIGVLVFVSSESERRFELRDLAVAEELARRAGVAIDNARLYEASQRERRRAEEANRAKDEFLSVASHELRTPLNAILGWSRMLRTGSLSLDKQQRALESIERNARIQVQLVEDILDVSRIVTGKLRLDVAPVEPSHVVEAAVDSVRAAADAKGVRLTVQLDPEAGIVRGDAARLQQVVWNLCSNAIKFTPKGGRVGVRVEREPGVVSIVVSDSGRGIEPAMLKRVFEPFWQADSSITRAHGGLGLGLAIVKHLVEQHGGSIEALSEGLDHGSTFCVRLPVAPVSDEHTSGTYPAAHAQAPALRTSAPTTAIDLSGLRILVVDDEADARELLQSLLVQCNAEVRTASSVTEAWERFRDAPPDVLVSDIGMPDHSGFDLVRRVRGLAASQGGRVPAVALTAYASLKDRTRALVEGFTAHAAKPIEPQELLAVIAALVGRHSGVG